MIKQYSLKKQLLALLGSTLIICWGFIIIWVEAETAHEIEEVRDATLAQTARTLLNLMLHNQIQAQIDMQNNIIAQKNTLQGHRYETNIAFIIYFPTGKQFRSASAPSFQLPSLDFLQKEIEEDEHDENGDNGYHDEYIDNKKWRTFYLYDNNSQIIIQTGESYVVRNELINNILFSVLSPLLFFLPLFGVMIWFSVGKGLKPLAEVRREIMQRDFNQLHPITLQNIPQEIKPLLDALNHLFIRLNQAFENERRFTADAAHELRTPLAGVKTQVEVAQRSQIPAERERALRQAIFGMERAGHLVTQLLSLARLDAQEQLAMKSIDLVELCIDMISEQMPAACVKKIDLGLETLQQSLIIQGNRDALYLLLRNLVDNAIRYTPEGGVVTLALEKNEKTAVLWVIDNGVGIAPEEYPHIFERFKRGNHPNITGSGLGLSIAKRIATLHQADLFFAPPGLLKGLKVGVRFYLNFVE